MNWKFWKREPETQHTTEDTLELQHQMTELQEQMGKMSEQLTKLSRHQVKSHKNTAEQLENFQHLMTEHVKPKELYAIIQQYQQQQKRLTESLLAMLDELDYAYAGIKETENTWTDSLHHWTENLLSILEQIGIYEKKVLDSSFDPRFAEAIKTITKAELAVPPITDYQIVEVIKRGFIDEQNQLIRKAQVITVEENPNE